MPKATKVGKFRSAARATSRDVRSAPLTAQHLARKKDVTNKDADATIPNPDEKEEPLSRGQRKRLAKRDQYLKREKMVMSSLRLKRLEEQKGKLDGLDAFREALGQSSPSTITAATKDKSKAAAKTLNLSSNTNKSKKTLANTEISHMSLVLQHPSFKENPFAAIQQHLRNSLAPEAEKLKQESKKREEQDHEMEVKKKEDKKERVRDAKFTNAQKKRRGYKTNRANRI